MKLRGLASVVAVVSVDDAAMPLRIEFLRGAARKSRYRWRVFMHDAYLVAPWGQPAGLTGLWSRWEPANAGAPALGPALEARTLEGALAEVSDHFERMGWPTLALPLALVRLESFHPEVDVGHDAGSEVNLWVTQRTLEFQVNRQWEFRLELSTSAADRTLFRWRVQLLETLEVVVAFNPPGFPALEALWVDVSPMISVEGHALSTADRSFHAPDLTAATRGALALFRAWADANRVLLAGEVCKRPRVRSAGSGYSL